MVNFNSILPETFNCSSIESMGAMVAVYMIVDEYRSETEIAMKNAGLVFVNIENDEIEFSF